MTVRDSIEKASFVGDPLNGKEEVSFSPDGRYFFVITKRGVLQSNQLQSTIWLFQSVAVSDLLKGSAGLGVPNATPLVTMATSSNADPITEARWAADGKSITFLGRNKDSERHLFAVTIKDTRLMQLSPSGQDVTDFDRSKDIFVFTTVPPQADSQLYQSGGSTLSDIEIGTVAPLVNLLYPNQGKSERREVWYVRDGHASPVLDSKTSSPILLTATASTLTRESSLLSLSPSGRYVVVTNSAAHVPVTWESYQTRYPFSKIVADKPNTKPMADEFRPLQYELIDLRTGKMSVLIDAPLGWWSAGFVDALRVLWLRDDKEVIVTNTFLPLEGNSVLGLPHSTRPWVVEVNIGSGKISCIKETAERGKNLRLTALEWQAANEQLVLRYFCSAPLRTGHKGPCLK